MDVIAYHPDSDTGPTHDDQPMIKRTIVDGVSAADIDEIRTTDIPHDKHTTRYISSQKRRKSSAKSHKTLQYGMLGG